MDNVDANVSQNESPDSTANKDAIFQSENIGKMIEEVREVIYGMSQIRFSALLLYKNRAALDSAEKAKSIEELTSEFVAKFLVLLGTINVQWLDPFSNSLIEALQKQFKAEWIRRQKETLDRGRTTKIENVNGVILSKNSMQLGMRV